MSPKTPPTGTLYLVPTPLDFGCMDEDAGATPLDRVLPAETLDVAARLSSWVTENAKHTRGFLKRVQQVRPLSTPLQQQQIIELPREVHKKGDHSPAADREEPIRQLLRPALEGRDLGLVSEAGMPAIADPGSSLVRAAHAMGLHCVSLVGPVSLMLALAASGLNGQAFAFVGYVPQDSAERARRIKELESIALKTGQTQILIETPYRNPALLQALLQHLHANTRLAVCMGLTLAHQATRSARISDWKKPPLDHGLQLPLKSPAIFLLGR